MAKHHAAGEKEVWGVPWLADARGIYYRREWLAQAGVDEQTAFRTHGDLVRTLETLEANGVKVPWSVPTRQTVLTVHAIASWVWGAGGRFLHPSGRELLLTQPEAIAGLKGYFDLRRFMPEVARGLAAPQATALFTQGPAAATIGGQWLAQGFPPETTEQWGVSLMPGASFVGGSHLVMWQYASPRNERTVLELVAFLSSQNFQRTFAKPVGMLPVRLDVLNEELITGHRIFSVFGTALRSGRTFTTSLRWGLVEDKLNETFGMIWADLLADPKADTVMVIQKHLEPTVSRLNATLSR